MIHTINQLVGKRLTDRVPYALRVLIVHGTDAWNAEVQDLSEGGCGIFRPSDFTVEPAELVNLYFFDAPGRATVLTARVARVTDKQVGFEYHEFQSIPPA